jgi:hypothetical protein
MYFKTNEAKPLGMAQESAMFKRSPGDANASPTRVENQWAKGKHVHTETLLITASENFPVMPDTGHLWEIVWKTGW